MNDQKDLGLDEDGIPILEEIIAEEKPTPDPHRAELEQIRREMILELYTELDSFSKSIAQAAAMEITTDLEVRIQGRLKEIIDAKLADLVEGVLKRPTY